MSVLTTQPEVLAWAADNLTGTGSARHAENSAVAAPTTGVVSAAADDISALSTAQFAGHAQISGVISTQAGAVPAMCISALRISAGSYFATEAAKAAAAT
jgi:PE family